MVQVRIKMREKFKKDLTLFIGNIAAAEMIASVGTGMKLNKINLLKSIESMLK